MTGDVKRHFLSLSLWQSVDVGGVSDWQVCCFMEVQEERNNGHFGDTLDSGGNVGRGLVGGRHGDGSGTGETLMKATGFDTLGIPRFTVTASTVNELAEQVRYASGNLQYTTPIVYVAVDGTDERKGE